MQLSSFDGVRSMTMTVSNNGDVERLKESSGSGCHMCGMILDRCKPDQEDFYIDLTGRVDGDFVYASDGFLRLWRSKIYVPSAALWSFSTKLSRSASGEWYRPNMAQHAS